MLRVLAFIALSGALGVSAWACDPDLPGRACSVDDDCFDDEICAGSSCVTGARTDADAEPTPDEGPTADMAPDQGPG